MRLVAKFCFPFLHISKLSISQNEKKQLYLNAEHAKRMNDSPTQKKMLCLNLITLVP